MTTKFTNSSTADNTLNYPNKSGTIALLDDISGGSGIDHYRGTDHTTVVSPVAGDYTLENLVTIYWTLPVKFEYLTSWKRTTPLYLGNFGFDTTFAGAAGELGLSNYVIGDLITVTVNHAMASSHSDTGAWNGTNWINISNSDYAMAIYSIEQTLNPLPNDISNLQTDVAALQNYEPPQYYLGNDHINPTNTPIAGAYTVEASGAVWFYDTAWNQVSGGTVQHYKGHFLTEAAVDAVTGVAGDYATYVYLTTVNSTPVDRLIYWDVTYNSGAGGWMDAVNGIDYYEQQLVRDKRSYVGNNHATPTVTPTSGAYTVETGGVLWLYFGTTWYKQGLKYWTETYDTTKLTTKWRSSTAGSKGTIIESNGANTIDGTGAIVFSASGTIDTTATGGLILNSSTATVTNCVRGAVLNSLYGECKHDYALAMGFNTKTVAPASFNTSATPNGDPAYRSGTAIIPFSWNTATPYTTTNGFGIGSGILLPAEDNQVTAMCFTITGEILIHLDGVFYNATLRATGFSMSGQLTYTSNGVTWLSAIPAANANITFDTSVLNDEITLLVTLWRTYSYLHIGATFNLTYLETPLIV